MKDRQERTPTPWKIWVFRIVGVLIPIFLLLFLEGALRLFHYGDTLHLFIEYPSDRNYLMFNPMAGRRYFSNQAMATTGNQEPFQKHKDPKTFRLFVLGESTTLGYPYFHNGSFHRWLQYRLMHSLPEKNIEVINLSLTAVNSYTVLGFAKEVVDYQPDAVLIYSGHNEFYGTLGVASTDRISGNPRVVHFILALRGWRFFQLMANLYEKSFKTQSADGGGTRMKMMVQDENIQYGSPLYKRGIAQFKTNISETVAVLRDHRIPVFISTLVSNEKDLKPFVSYLPDSAQFPQFQKNFALGQRAFLDNHMSVAHSYFQEADKVYADHALSNYYDGKTCYALGDYALAARHLTEAKDLDGLRFRASAECNSVLTELCHANEGVHLVDARAAFADNSPHQIIGHELILEHVHPNLRGYAVLSDIFYRRMKEAHLFTVSSEMPFTKLLTDMPVTIVDSLAGAYKIHNLKSTWPFNEALGTDTLHIETMEAQLAWKLVLKQIDWEAAANALYSNYINSHQPAKARRVIEGLVLEHPYDVSLYERTAMLCGELGQPDAALFYFKKAFALAPSFDNAKFICLISLQQDNPEEAIPFLDYAIAHNTSRMNLQLVKQGALGVAELKKRFAADSANGLLLISIAQRYLQMGNTEGALKYVRKTLAKDPHDPRALSMRSQLEKK